MRKCILSYSMTGNNEALAKRLSQIINADHIIVSEKKRTMAKIVLDMVFGRIPKVQPDANVLNGFKEVIVIGPIWMEKVASPLRPYLLYIKEHNVPYSFVSISGGTLHKNPKLKNDIIKYGGDNLLILKDLYISDLPSKDDDTTKDTGGYKITNCDLDALENQVASALNSISDSF